MLGDSLEDAAYVRKPSSFPTYRFPENAGTIHFMSRGRFEVSQKSLKDGLSRILRISSASQYEERFPDELSFKVLGDWKYFFIKRFRTFTSF